MASKKVRPRISGKACLQARHLERCIDSVSRRDFTALPYAQSSLRGKLPRGLISTAIKTHAAIITTMPSHELRKKQGNGAPRCGDC
jgi:hypothetical protein